MSKKKPTKTNGAAHAKPSKPAQEPTEAPETAEAGANGAADHPAPDADEGTPLARVADAILVELRKDPAVSWLESDLIEKMAREQDVPEETVEDALADLEDDAKIVRSVGPNDPGSVKLWGVDATAATEPPPVDGVEEASKKLRKPTRYLPCVLSRAEIDALRGERERDDERIEMLEAQLEATKQEAKSLKEQIEELQKAGMEKSKRVRAGTEHRYIPCEDRREIDRRPGAPANHQVMVTYRLDTNEVVEVRELSRDELQGVLFDEAPAASPRNGGVEMREATA